MTDEPTPEPNNSEGTPEESVPAAPDSVQQPVQPEPVVSDAASAPAENVAPAAPTEPASSMESSVVEEPAAPVAAEPASETNAEATPTAESTPAEVAPAEPPTAEDSSEAPASPEPSAEAPQPDDRPADKVRERMGAGSKDRAVGSEDVLSQRPETPSSPEAVDIPELSDVEGDLAAMEAEISSAMGEIESEPTPVAAPATAETTEATEAADEAAPVSADEIGPGSEVTGTVQALHGDDVFVNAGLRSDIVVSLKQFPEDKPPTNGDSIKVVIESIDDDGLMRARLPQARTKAGGDWDALSVGQVVDCVVTATNKGGLQVTVSSLKGFLPASQVDLGYVANLEQFVGQKLTVQITEVKPKKRNLVVSRRVLLQAERESQQADFWLSLETGQDHTGVVKTIKNYGAFVNLGPIDGFLHIGEMSWSRINHPNEVLQEGQEIQVRILKIDKEKNRISLGMKQLVANPWQGLSDRYPAERIVGGKVTRTADFGAFVELEPGVEGLVHISQLAWRRVGSVNEVLKVGDERDFQVLEVDQKRRRVSLSLKALEKRPEPKGRPEEDAPPPRKENPNLRGGMGDSKGGGLFGDPSDFG